jgi:predicted nucleotidyltransferase
VQQPRISYPKERLISFSRRDQVSRLALFGSVLRDDFRSESDVDVLIAFDPTARVSFMSLGRMKGEFSILLQRSVDLVPQDGLKPVKRDEVLASAHEIYSAKKLYLIDIIEASEAFFASLSRSTMKDS